MKKPIEQDPDLVRLLSIVSKADPKNTAGNEIKIELLACGAICLAATDGSDNSIFLYPEQITHLKCFLVTVDNLNK